MPPYKPQNEIVIKPNPERPPEDNHIKNIETITITNDGSSTTRYLISSSCKRTLGGRQASCSLAMPVEDPRLSQRAAFLRGSETSWGFGFKGFKGLGLRGGNRPGC